MDIKDFILIGGGILIAVVVCHGFWIAYRAKKEPYRLDIVPDLIPDHMDDMEWLRGELPNGGSRPVRRRGSAEPAQTTLELEPPIETEFVDDFAEPDIVDVDAGLDEVPIETDPIEAPRRPAAQAAPAPTRVVEVDIASEPIVAERLATDVAATESPVNEQVHDGPDVEELLVINVLAPRGTRFAGEHLVQTLRGQGLRYGEMNIFHRVEPTTKAKLFSIANILEPGTFDLADLDSLASPGMSFFLQLPGPDDAAAAFDDMLTTARNIAAELGGEVRDEQLSVLTGQTAEHMRQRIADFARRRLSRRASF